MVEEIWKPVLGFERLYEINIFGEIRNSSNFNMPNGGLKPSKIIRPARHKQGYLMVRLYDDNGQHTKFLHRLIAEAFIPNPDNKPFVNHIDGNKQNNNWDNLEWCTRSENNIHAYKNRLNRASKQILLKRIESGESELFYSMAMASMAMGKHPSHISKKIREGVFSNYEYEWGVVSEA